MGRMEIVLIDLTDIGMLMSLDGEFFGVSWWGRVVFSVALGSG